MSENPVYVQGDWNATGGNSPAPHAATAVMADAVTLLSNDWNDTISFTQPVHAGQPYPRRARPGIAWPSSPARASPSRSRPAPPTDFGTDGGAHNFLRYLESGAIRP